MQKRTARYKIKAGYMDSFFDYCMHRYYMRKKAKYKGSWREEYFEYLENFAFGYYWDHLRKGRLKSNLEEDKYGVAKGKLKKKWLFAKARFQMAFYGVRDDEFFTMGYFCKNIFAPRKAITKARMYWMNEYLNSEENIQVIRNKAKFAELIGEELFGRKYLKSPFNADKFEETFKDCKRVIVKPLKKFGGHDIKVYRIGSNPRKIHKRIKRTYQRKYIVEEYFRQTGFMHKLNPSSLNTIRVITIREPGTQTVHVMDAYLRVGVPGAVIDNYSSGGVTYDVDIKTGTIGTGRNKDGGFGKVLTVHPGTNKSYTGRVVPHWKSVLRTCKKTHKLVPPHLDYIGWDVCLSGKKIIFVEANTSAGFGRTYNGMRDNKWAKMEEILDRSSYDK